MFGTANRRAPSGPASSPVMDAVEATRAPDRQPLQRPADHPGPMVNDRPALASSDMPTTASAASTGSMADEGRLSVGRDIRLTGELKSCESLIVEGVVNLDLQGTKYLEVLEGGTFEGSAMVESAEIAGSFQGDLTVTGLLVLHPLEADNVTQAAKDARYPGFGMRADKRMGHGLIGRQRRPAVHTPVGGLVFLAIHARRCVGGTRGMDGGQPFQALPHRCRHVRQGELLVRE